MMGEDDSAKHHLELLMGAAPTAKDARNIKDFIDAIDAAPPIPHQRLCLARALDQHQQRHPHNDEITVGGFEIDDGARRRAASASPPASMRPIPSSCTDLLSLSSAPASMLSSMRTMTSISCPVAKRRSCATCSTQDIWALAPSPRSRSSAILRTSPIGTISTATCRLDASARASAFPALGARPCLQRQSYAAAPGI